MLEYDYNEEDMKHHIKSTLAISPMSNDDLMNAVDPCRENRLIFYTALRKLLAENSIYYEVQTMKYHSI